MMTDTTDTRFPDIIGQAAAKRRLNFYLDGHEKTSVLPHLMFVAQKGGGKTTLAKATARKLRQSDDPTKPKEFLEINCSTIKNVKQFFNQVIIPHVHQQEITVLFDEASELPKDVEMALLTICNPNPDHWNTFSFEDYVVDFDFRRQSFMFATTEAQSIFHALMDRCERVDLEEYSHNELGRIVQLNRPDVVFDHGVLDEIATVLRGNARAAQKMAGNIQSSLGSRNRFAVADWNELKYALGILPLGLTRIELQILNVLQRKPNGASLTFLAANTGMTTECIRRDFEMFLQKQGLMEISRGGRKITSKGQTYLKELPSESPPPKAKPVRIELDLEGK